MNAELAWFKSSYSGAEGGACLEVALEWRRSSHSGAEGGQCVEVAACPATARTARTVHVRDSKAAPAGPTLAFTPAEWSAFVAFTVGTTVE